MFAVEIRLTGFRFTALLYSIVDSQKRFSIGVCPNTPLRHRVIISPLILAADRRSLDSAKQTSYREHIFMSLARSYTLNSKQK